MKPSPLRQAYKSAVRQPPPAAAERFKGKVARALVGLVAQLDKQARGKPFALCQRDVADAMVLQQQAVSAAVKRLRAEGVLRLVSGGGARPSTYTFHQPVVERTIVSDE